MLIRQILLALLIIPFTFGAQASSYPSKPIELVITFPAGGAADATGRLLTKRLGDVLGQPVITMNRPGAGGNIAASFVARSSPDGYTLLFGTNNTHGINPALYPELPYDPVKDFVPVALAQVLPSFLVVSASLPVKNVTQLIDYVKKHSGKVNYASPGNGSTGQLAAESFKSALGLNMVHIPFRGGGEAMTSLLSGRTQVFFATAPNVLPHLSSGKVRVLAVTTSRRYAGMPDIPTIVEAGGPPIEANAWTGIFAPKGTPKEVIGRLAAALAEISKDPDYREQVTRMGAEAAESSPEKFTKFVHAELQKWATAVRISGARVN